MAIYKSDYYEYHRLTDGVYALLVKPESEALDNGGETLVNAGLIDLGDGVLMFDLAGFPGALDEAQRAAGELSGKPVIGTVISHGELACAAAANEGLYKPVLSSSVGDRLEQLIPDKKHKLAVLHGERQKLERRLVLADDDLTREGLLGRIKKVEEQQLLHNSPLVRPAVTFERTLRLYGTGRMVELVAFGPARTQSDTVLFLPQERILFGGSLVDGGQRLPQEDGDASGWQNALRELSKLDARCIVPGHGETGGAELLHWDGVERPDRI